MAAASLVPEPGKLLLNRRERQLYRNAAEKFNSNAKEGIAFLLAQSLIAEESPEELARIFHSVEVKKIPPCSTSISPLCDFPLMFLLTRPENHELKHS